MKQFLPLFLSLWAWIETCDPGYSQHVFIKVDPRFLARQDSITAPFEVSIADAKLLPYATEVTIQGVLTVTHHLGGPAYLQDETGGIPVYDGLIHGPGKFQIGDCVKLTARLDQFNQQIQLVDISALEFLGSSTPVQPKGVSIGNIADLEGLLVTIPAAEFMNKKGLLYPDNNYQIFDVSGSMELRMDGDVQDLVGRFVPITSENITGVLGSFGGNLQLLPRLQEDLPGTSPYIGGGSDVSPNETLDIMTWNMEFFGASLPGFGPADVRLQMQNALRVLQDSQPDLIAVQEISEPDLLKELIVYLPGYTLQCSDRFSRSFEEPDASYPPQRLCYIYNTEVITMVRENPLFGTLYDEVLNGSADAIKDYPTGTAFSFWASGRLPYLMEVQAKIQDTIETIYFINIHAKSGAGKMDLDRKRYDIQVLKDSLDVFYSDKNVVILGDYNDDLDESIGGGKSTYDVIIDDSNYHGISLSLSETGLRSYMYNENMIDHIIISNELFDNYLHESTQVYIPFCKIPNYGRTTSDHIPVMARMIPGIRNQHIDEKLEMFNKARIIKYYPNPFKTNIKINLDQSLSLPIKVSFNDLGGNVIFEGEDQMINGECDLDLKGLSLKPGVYFLHLTFGDKSKVVRLVKK